MEGVPGLCRLAQRGEESRIVLPRVVLLLIFHRPDGTPVAIPGHHIPMAIVGTFILAFGWFGFFQVGQ